MERGIFHMLKKSFITFTMILLVGLLAACGGNQTVGKEKQTKVYQSETGAVNVPVNPKRIVITTESYTGNLLALGITPVGVMAGTKDNKFIAGKLNNVEVITPDSVEKILELEPDLIISTPDNKNNKKYADIAPTVIYTYNKLDYLEQHIAIGKLVGKEQEARNWVENWKKTTKADGEKIKAKIGADTTVMVMEVYEKNLYVFGNAWGRGTEVIYQALGLKAPEKVIKDAMGPGYYTLSTEVIPQYAGEYIFLSDSGSDKPDTTFMQSNLWRNLSAVKNKRVFSIDSKSFYYNDPMSLEKELSFIKEKLLNN